MYPFSHCKSAEEPFHFNIGVRASASIRIEAISLVLAVCPITSILENELHLVDKSLWVKGLARIYLSPLFSPGCIASILECILATNKTVETDSTMIPYSAGVFLLSRRSEIFF